MDVYRISGTFKMGRNMMPFTKEFFATSEDTAREKLLCDLGSKHKTIRKDIHVQAVGKIEPKDITDTHLRKLLEEI